ncbi:MAG: hypothetical protein ABSE62_00695 [Chthoniobacteraceae bacterium]
MRASTFTSLPSDSPNANDNPTDSGAPASWSPASHPAIAGGSPVGVIAGKIATVVEPPAASTPLALTTPADGATPSQAAVLQRLQNDFVSSVSTPGQNFDSAAYAKTWRVAQELSDSNFAQQFGSEAFIEAQLAQVHGGN